MPIQALPKATAQLLSSGQVLTGPASLVKELVDNAIDAQATSIDISISPNTLDKVEVRDNGRGIPIDDLRLVGRRGHTSKLRSFEELGDIGGSTLGFRGEALASALDLGEVTITTRTDGDIVGMLAKLQRSGEHALSKTSHPVGTTVLVTSLFSNLPVRKQTAAKEATKTIAVIKQLLKSYALARVDLRLSFKVFKEPKHNWIFAPKRPATVEDATLSLFGKTLRDFCVSVSFPAENETGNGHAIEALVLRPDFDLTYCHHGQFISIDGRPVSTARGLPKKIVSAYRARLRNAREEPAEKIRDAFLRLNIVCTKGAYDVNIEPAKDEVLFENDDLVMENLEQLFRNVYGEVDQPVTHARKEVESDFNLLLSRSSPTKSGEPAIDTLSTPAIEIVPSTQLRETANNVDEIEDDSDPMILRGRRWDVDMSEGYTLKAPHRTPFKKTDMVHVIPGDATHEATQEDESEKSFLNPWLIAKMNSSTTSTKPPPYQRPTLTEAGPGNEDIRQKYMQPLVVASSSKSNKQAQGENGLSKASSRPLDVITMSNDSPLSGFVAASSLIKHTETLPGPSTPTLSGLIPSSKMILEKPWLPSRQSSPKTNSRPPERHPSYQRPMSPPTSSPVHDERPGQASSQFTLPSTSPGLVGKIMSTPAPTSSELQLTIEDAMDFEHRKVEATRRHREQSRGTIVTYESAPSSQPTSSNPHLNRRNAALKALQPLELRVNDEVDIESPLPRRKCLPEGDPRTYLMRRIRSNHRLQEAGLPIRRIKTMKLPMETIGHSEELHQLVQNLPVNSPELRLSLSALTAIDEYISTGSMAEGLLFDDIEMNAIEQHLTLMLKHHKHIHQA